MSTTIFISINISMKYLIFVLALAGCSNSVLFNRVIPPTEPVDTAASMVGLHEKTNRKELREFMNIDPVRTQWCSGFMNSILEEHDIPGSGSVYKHPLVARSFLKWGVPVKEPEFGDVVVFSRGSSSWKGHVGFYIDTDVVDGIPSYIVLGGNQDDQISYKAYPISRLLGIRRIPE
jgi:uncharacterized protein (TIGR02594 family)